TLRAYAEACQNAQAPAHSSDEPLPSSTEKDQGLRSKHTRAYLRLGLVERAANLMKPCSCGRGCSRPCPLRTRHPPAAPAKWGALISGCAFKNFEAVRDFREGIPRSGRRNERARPPVQNEIDRV